MSSVGHKDLFLIQSKMMPSLAGPCESSKSKSWGRVFADLSRSIVHSLRAPAKINTS